MSIEKQATHTKRDPSSLAVIAITVLTQVIEQSKSTTMMELNNELKNAVKVIKNTCLQLHNRENSNDAVVVDDFQELRTSTISLYSGCELFLRFVTRQFVESNDFNAVKQKLSERGTRIAELSAQSKKKVITHFKPFFQRDNMTVLVIGHSKVVMSVLLHYTRSLSYVRFSVIIPEGRPDGEGYKSANELVRAGIPVTMVVDSAVAHVMHSVDFVLSGAEGIVESGGVINRIGTYQIAILAKVHKKPFYVAAESYKFVRSYPLGQSDISSFEYINPPLYTRITEEPKKKKKGGASDSDGDSDEKVQLKELDSRVVVKNPTSDFTPPSYVTLLFTDLGILTPSGVSDELIKLYT